MFNLRMPLWTAGVACWIIAFAIAPPRTFIRCTHRHRYMDQPSNSLDACVELYRNPKFVAFAVAGALILMLKMLLPVDSDQPPGPPEDPGPPTDPMENSDPDPGSPRLRPPA